MSLSDICAIRGNQPRALAEARLALAEAERAGDQLMVAAVIAKRNLRGLGWLISGLTCAYGCDTLA